MFVGLRELRKTRIAVKRDPANRFRYRVARNAFTSENQLFTRGAARQSGCEDCTNTYLLRDITEAVYDCGKTSVSWHF
jgi:hypothetical protein